MELTFEKIGDWYISEFEVTSDFNLHIEKEPKGDFYLYQRTSSSGQYDIIEDFGYKKGGDNVIDLDFQALVYPKWIKIKSAVKPLVATITTDGEVNEVVYQAKDIEITSNGTTKVTTDAGYAALSSVNVKVNVPQSGGSGGNKIVYDANSQEDLKLLHDRLMLLPPESDDIYACEIDFTCVLINIVTTSGTQYNPTLVTVVRKYDRTGNLDYQFDLMYNKPHSGQPLVNTASSICGFRMNKDGIYEFFSNVG